MRFKQWYKEQKTAWMLMIKADRMEPIHNSQDQEDHPPYLVLQNRSKSVGLMTYAAQVVEFSDYAEKHNSEVIVDLKNYPCVNLDDSRVGIDNAWEYYYEQPFHDTPELDQLYEKYSFSFLPCYRKKLLAYYPGINRSIAYRLFYNKRTEYERITIKECLDNSEIYRRWCDIARRRLHLNEKTQSYVEEEYQSIIAGKRVLGVSIRGTDYTQKRAYGHPIQPPIEKVIADAVSCMHKYGYTHIYLSCEERAAVDCFETAFPGRILINKRKFFDNVDFRKVSGIADISFNRENDAYLRGLEYLSSIYLLSRCDALIAGQNTGSQMAYIINGGKYEYVYFYSIGKYGIDDKHEKEV